MAANSNPTSVTMESTTSAMNGLSLGDEKRPENDQGGRSGALPVPTPPINLPFTLFVYGPTADPFFLTHTLKMGSNPELPPSSIWGYRMKFSRRYPAPIPAQGKTLSEFSIQVENETQLRKITKWYGGAYKMVDCRIEVMRNEGQEYAPSTKNWVPSRWVKDRVVDGKVFVWGQDLGSEELQEGYWDEGWWEMQRDRIMGIKKQTNPRVLASGEVKQRSKAEMLVEEQREEERQRLWKAEEAKKRKVAADSKKREEKEEAEAGKMS